MSDETTEIRAAIPEIRGQLHKFLPLPVMPHHVQWFEAGPVTFGLEARVIQDGKGGKTDRSASIHVFNADRSEEYARFDAFNDFCHYHYILNGPQHNVVWSYDEAVNGPMLPWALSALRCQLPAILRRAEAPELAEQIEREGFDTTALDRMEAALEVWEPVSAADALRETRDWYFRWKKLHPQFNTAD